VQFRHEELQIRKPVSTSKNDDGDPQLFEVLLEFNASICRDENIESPFTGST
jgi:hypothetical protein